jgi:transposase
MAQNFLLCDRDQALLVPPSLREWLGQDELVWCVLDVVAEMDLAVVYGDYRADGHGRAAFDPGMMVALLLYAYAVGERSSRAIERRCDVDIAFRVITANQVDHATIARFRARHEQALAGLFGQVLALCARSGLLSLGVVAIDSTKIAANASGEANRSYEQIAAELLAEAEAVDEAEDQQFGQARGDELPPEMADPATRRARLAEAKRQIEAEHEAAKDAHRERLEYRAALEAEQGRRFAGRPPKAPPEQIPSKTRVNITDLDSRSVKTRKGFIQGYNAQAATTSEQIIVAAEIIGNGVDYGLLEAVTDTAVSELVAAGVGGQIDVLLADAGYWASDQIESLAARGIQPLVPPDGQNPKKNIGSNRKGPRYDFMRRVIASDHGRALYSKRKHTIEPIFGQIKHNRHITRFQTQGHHRLQIGVATDRHHPQHPQALESKQHPRSRLSTTHNRPAPYATSPGRIQRQPGWRLKLTSPQQPTLYATASAKPMRTRLPDRERYAAATRNPTRELAKRREMARTRAGRFAGV